jgi:antitoxin component of MazEF toxin-antitoxin module
MSGKRTKVAKWGHGAAVRINAVALEAAHLKIDDPVELVATEGQITIVRLQPEITLDSLLDQFDPAVHRHPLHLDFPPAGTETGSDN